MFLLVSTCGIGRIVIEPLYQLNSPFCWHSVRIGIYGAARTVATQTLGTLVIKVNGGWGAPSGSVVVSVSLSSPLITL